MSEKAFSKIEQGLSEALTYAKLSAENDALRRLVKMYVEDFRDYHYQNCPADTGEGECQCYAGMLTKSADEILATEPGVNRDGGPGVRMAKE